MGLHNGTNGEADHSCTTSARPEGQPACPHDPRHRHLPAGCGGSPTIEADGASMAGDIIHASSAPAASAASQLDSLLVETSSPMPAPAVGREKAAEAAGLGSDEGDSPTLTPAEAVEHDDELSLSDSGFSNLGSEPPSPTPEERISAVPQHGITSFLQRMRAGRPELAASHCGKRDRDDDAWGIRGADGLLYLPGCQALCPDVEPSKPSKPRRERPVGPGCQAYLGYWLSETQFILAHEVYDIASLARALRVDRRAMCWPTLLSIKYENVETRLNLCTGRPPLAHTSSAASASHTRPARWSAELVARHARRPEKHERKLYSEHLKALKGLGAAFLEWLDDTRDGYP